MTFCLYELARRSDIVARLRDELDRLLQDDAEFKSDNFDGLRDHAGLLNAYINESVRLWPPVPSGLQRTLRTPLTLPPEATGNLGQAQLVLPTDTVVSTHTWTIHRDPRNFYNPDKFEPERWLRMESLNAKTRAHNAKAWAPFGYGATSCIGKNLAYMEMRWVLAQLISRFDFSISPADDDVFRESVRDQFVVSAGEMRLKICLRQILA